MIPKFRVWCKNRKRWERDVCYIQQDGLLYQRSKGSERLIPILSKNHAVMQSTGMEDKNGVEIYEGDIVLFTIEDGFDYVYGKPGRINLSLQWGAGVRAISSGNYPLRKCREVRIIGNIYENPELLEVEG
nr:YopX family protein [Enterococcus avium]